MAHPSQSGFVYVADGDAAHAGELEEAHRAGLLQREHPLGSARMLAYDAGDDAVASRHVSTEIGEARGRVRYVTEMICRSQVGGAHFGARLRDAGRELALGIENRREILRALLPCLGDTVRAPLLGLNAAEDAVRALAQALQLVIEKGRSVFQDRLLTLVELLRLLLGFRRRLRSNGNRANSIENRTMLRQDLRDPRAMLPP